MDTSRKAAVGPGFISKPGPTAANASKDGRSFNSGMGITPGGPASTFKKEKTKYDAPGFKRIH